MLNAWQLCSIATLGCARDGPVQNHGPRICSISLSTSDSLPVGIQLNRAFRAPLKRSNLANASPWL